MPYDEPGAPAATKRAHPIDSLMETAMSSIKQIVNVNTILGDPIESPDGNVIIPVSRVSMGFAAGGTEYEPEGKSAHSFPFGGGSGAGISVNPVAFMVVGRGETRLLPIHGNGALYERLIDLAPKMVEQFQRMGAKNGHTNGQYQAEGVGLER